MTKYNLSPYIAALRQFAENLPAYLGHCQIAELWVSEEHGEARQTAREAIEKEIRTAVTTEKLKAEVAKRNPNVQGGFELITSATLRNEIRDSWLGDTWVLYTIHRDDFQAWLRPTPHWPLPEESLLRRWFLDKGGADSCTADQLQRYARLHAQELQAERQPEWERWQAQGQQIQATRKRKASNRELAELVKKALDLPDSIETIRKRL